MSATHKARAEAFDQAMEGASPALRAAIEDDMAHAGWLAPSHYGHALAGGRPCRVSYGWCFTHMCRDYEKRTRAASFGPYDVITPGDGPI